MVIDIEKKKMRALSINAYNKLLHYQLSSIDMHYPWRESNVPELKSERRDETSLKLPFDTLKSKKKKIHARSLS